MLAARSLAILLFCLAATPGHGQSLGDLVEVWLVGKAHTASDYRTCQTDGQADAICAWNTGTLGAQPSAAALQALAPAWQNQQKGGQFATLRDGGLAITSTATSALNATYATDDVATARLTFILVRLAGGKGLPGGGANFQYPDKSGTPHTFTGAQIANLGQAVQDYLYSLYLARLSLAAGNAANWPAASATIP